MRYIEGELDEIFSLIKKESEMTEDKGIWIDLSISAYIEGDRANTKTLSLSPELFGKIAQVLLNNYDD